MKFVKGLSIGLTLILMASVAWGQTNPTAQSLPFSENFGTSSFSSLPAGFAAWNGTGLKKSLSAAESSIPTGDATVTNRTGTSTTAGVSGLSISGDGRVYIQTSSNTTNGTNQLALAISTVNKQNITISFKTKVELPPDASRAYGVVAQYRIGTSGSWTTFTNGSIEYTNQVAGTTTSFTELSFGSDAENQSVVQIRWATWRADGSGSSGGLSIDDIVISGNEILENTAPVISSPTASSITTTSANLSANIISDGGASVSARGFVYSLKSENSDPTIGGTGVTNISSGSGTGSFNETISSLNVSSTYTFKGYATNSEGTSYTNSTDFITLKEEPVNHVSTFIATVGSPNYSLINISWTDASADGYLIKGSSIDYGDISDPADGTVESDGVLVKNVAQGIQSASFSKLTAETTYYFKIFPYNNSGSNIDYKTDAIVPTTSVSTDVQPDIPKLLISEVTDPSDVWQARFVELYNNSGSTITFDSETWYLSTQFNGGSTWGEIQLTGSLNHGSFYIIAYSQLDFETQYSSSANLYSNTINGNGDDGYFLYYDGNREIGILVDAFGLIDQDGTGYDWDYTDSRAVRSGVTQGNPTWTASEWTITSANVSDCTPGEFDADQSLPVTLSSFTAKAVKGNVVLEWETSAEIENQGFVLSREERGTRNEWDGFETRPEVIASFAADDALKGQGTTTETTKYVFVDKTVEPGKIYVYTLADVDYAGVETLLEKVEVKVEAEGTVVADGYALDPVYPNPFNAALTVPFTLTESMTVSIELYSLTGQRIMTVTNREFGAGSYNYTVQADDLASGIYVVRSVFNGRSHMQKAVLLK